MQLQQITSSNRLCSQNRGFEDPFYLFIYLRQKQLKTAYDELWGEVNFVHVFIILWSLS